MTGNSWRRNAGDDEQKAGESLLRDDHDQRKEPYLSGKEWIGQSDTTSKIFYPPKSSSSSPRAAVDASIPPGFGGDRGIGCPLKVVEGERVGDLRRLSNEVENDTLKLPISEHETSCERETFDRGGPMTWASTQRGENENRPRFPGKISTLRVVSGCPQPVAGRDLILNDKEFERRVDRYSSSREDHQRKGGAATQLNSGRDFSLTYQEMEGRIDRYANNREDSHRRVGAIPQPDTGREPTLAEKEMEGRVDRYASSHSRDGEHGIKSLPSSNYDWRMRDRSTVTKTRSRSPPFFSPTTSSQDAGVRFQGAVDISSSKLSPQVSGASSLVLESGQDDPSHLSPPKRPRLGWGQGLAKYEKKKVVDCDDVSKSSSLTRDEVLSKADPQPEEESPLDRVSTSGSWVTGPTSARALLPEISIGDNLPTSTEGRKVELVGSSHEIRRGNSLEGGVTTVSEFTGAHSDNSICKPTVCIGLSGAPQLSLNLVSDQVEVPHPSRYLRLTRGSDEIASGGQRKISNDGSSKATLNPEVVEDLSTWTKEAILLRVEKVEGEIDSVEKELAKVAREIEDHFVEKDCNSIDQGRISHEVASRTTEIQTPNQNAADDPASAWSIPSLPSPSMVDSVLVDPADERIAEEVVSLSPRADSPISFGAEQVHNEELPLRKSSSACSGETDHHREADVLKEITNDMPIEEKRQLVGKDLQLKHATDEESPCGLEARSIMAYQWSLVYSLIQENRKLAKAAAAPLSNLLSKDASYDRPKFYNSPEDAPVWRQNVESHLKKQERMQLRLVERRKLLRFKERILALKYRALKAECPNGLLGTCQRRDRLKAVRRWEVDRRNAAALAFTNQKPTLRLRPVLAGSVRTDAVQDDGHVKKKFMVVLPANHLRQDLKMPSMIIDERERCFRRFVNRNGLVEDPVSYEEERKAMNPWSPEEKKVFLDKFTVFNKNFSKIASFLEHKTTADCVQYYYRNQKSEDFEKVRRRQQLKKRRDYSMSGASYLATTTPGNNRSHRDANVTRVQALTLAAYAASRDCSRALRGSSNKAVDKARPVTTCDSGNLEHMVVKPGCARESKSGGAPDPVPLGLSPGSLSGGIPPASRNFREKLSAKSGSGFVSPSAKGIVAEQHSGSRGMRSTVVQRDLAKSDGEEVDSQWTDSERQLFTDAVAKFGKEFKSIADHVGSKTQTQCKTFFSKIRKKFRLDELVEQFQESPHLGLGLGGVAMKTESACDERVENLAEPYPFSVESTGSQVQGGKSPVGPSILEKAEINVAAGLMLLGQALEAEVAAVPPKVPDLPSSVSPTPSGVSLAPPEVSPVPSGARVSSMVRSNVSPVIAKISIRSKISDVGSRISFLPMISDLISQVVDLPSEASDLPVKDLDLPSKVPDLAGEVSDVPFAVSDVPTKVSDVPTKASDLLSMVSQLPPKVPDLPLEGSDFVSKDSVSPSDVSEVPVTKPGDGAVVAVAPEEHDIVSIEGLPEKSTGPVRLEEQKQPEQMVKSERIEDGPIVTDGLMKIQSTMKHEPETLETVTMVLRGQPDKNSAVQLVRSTEKSSGVFSLAHPEEHNFSSAIVKSEPVVRLDAGGACLTGLLPPTAQAVPLAVAAPPIIHSGQPRETASRINAAGEFKPRREPTSWTQEEKEKFAEIIRRHGKDWTLLRENLPAKSLIQIKTYFQNSKAKLGFLPSDGLTNITARGASTRKRKAEESDTSSNAGSTGQNPNPKVSSEDISQKVISSSMISTSTNIGTPTVGGDGLGYPHFNQGMGQSGEDSSSARDIQKIMRRMVAANEYPSQSPIPGGLMPLFQPGAFGSPNQQPLLLGGQKPQLMVGHQSPQQSLIPPAILQQQQQISQMTPSQRQLLTKVVQQLHQQQVQHQQQQLLHQQQEQQQNPQTVVHQPQQLAHHLQQQVTQLVAQQQQMAHILQPQLLQHHVQQATPLASGSLQHPLGSRPKQAVSQQQSQTVHSNRVHHPASQQQPYLQQQQFLQQQKQLIHQLQQEQLAQQMQFQLLQTQKQIQQQPQLQHLQQLQQLQQVHQQQLQQLRKEHAQMQVHQQQVQQKQIHQQVQQQVQQQQVQPSIGLFRSPFQGFPADLLRQSEIVEQRVTTSKPALPREDMQQVHAQRPAQILPQQTMRTSSASEPQRLRLGDVKLFGQSLLSQPPPNAGQASISSSQKLWQPVMAPSTGPVAIPANNLSKVYGKDPLLVSSTFPRAGSILSGEGHTQSWPAASTGNLDLWSSVMGGLQGVVLYKNEDAKSELCSVQDAVARMTARLSQKTQEKDCENIGLLHNLDHLDPGVGQDLKTKDVAGDVVRGKDVVDVPSETGRDRARLEGEWRNDSLQPTSAGSVEAFTRPSQKVGLASVAKPTHHQSFAAMEAILASADQRSAQVGVSTSGQGQGAVNDEFVQQVLALWRESGNEGMSGSGSLGSSASALKKLLSGSDMSQLLSDGGVYVGQPNALHANFLNTPKSSWPHSHGPHAPDPQVALAGPSFQSGALLRSHTGQEEQSGTSDSKNLESL